MKSVSLKPFVLIKTAASMDGKIGARNLARVLLSNELDIKAVDKLRSECDAILVGEATLKKDNPRPTLKCQDNIDARIKRGQPPHPAKVGISKLCDLDVKSNFFTVGDARKFIFTTRRAPEKNVKRVKKYAHVYRVGEARINVKKLLGVLAKNGIKKLMVEGGGRTNYEFLKAGVVDKMRVAIAPIIIGQEDAPAFAYGNDFLPELDFDLKNVERLGDMVILWYARA